MRFFVIPAIVLLTVPACGESKEKTESVATDRDTPAKTHTESEPDAPSHPKVSGHGRTGTPMMPKTPPPSEPSEVTPDGLTRTDTVGTIALVVPTQWEKQVPASRMRLAQYHLPGPGGGASLVVFRFPGGGGAVGANVDRWLGQIEQPDGSSTKDSAKVESRTVGRFNVTTVDAAGTYVATMRPGTTGPENKPNTRMLAAVIEGQGNPFFFKVVGPQATVDLWAGAWTTLVDSIEVAE